MKYYLYILKTVDNTLYCGIARDVLARFEEHKKGVGAKYTRSHKPESLVYVDIYEDKSSASKEEYRIKKTLNREDKLKLIEKNKQRTKDILDLIKK
ncbi:MAG: GIY-YIG nuclease family protein [Candidatus Gastranaerophilales bacterium]|nr:GIY-YIG nuclease family protein [Candidatus Gastranaerophilales bacterium]